MSVIVSPAKPTIESGHDAGSGRARPNSTYGQILRSSVLVGGSAALNIAVGVVRTKAMALILGPAGFGLMGAFSTIADLTRSVAELGINSSGVRQIADAVGSGQHRRITITVTVLRRVAIALAVVGAALLLLFNRPIAVFTFGNTQHAGAIALLSLAVAFRLMADGYVAMLQGMRRIGDMAKGSVIGAIGATLVSVPIVYWLREEGVALSLVAVGGLSLAINWWYARRSELETVPMTLTELRHESSELLRLGFAFMASGMLMMGAAYLVRIVVLRQEGLVAAGLYQSAWAIGGVYVGFILQAMGADFYPRLVGVASQNAECNRLVNEQAEVSLLLAGPGVMATLVLGPVVLSILYSAEFAGAVDVLRWICIGIAMRVISWPIGYIILAKNSRIIFMATEIAWAIVNVSGTFVAVRVWGLAGAGIAFFVSYVFHVVMIRVVVGRMTGFQWSRRNVLLITAFSGLSALVIVSYMTLPARSAAATGVVALLASSACSAYGLSSLVPGHLLPRRVQQLVEVCRSFAPGRARRIPT